MRRMQREFMRPLCVRRCGSFRSNPQSNRICNRFIVRGSELSALELRSSIICGGFLASMAPFCPKAHGAFWRRRKTLSRLPNCLISRGNSSATYSMKSAPSISDSTSSTDNSWLFAGLTKPAGGSRSCQASVL